VAGLVDASISSDSFMGADRYRLSFSLAVSGADIWAGNAIDLAISLGLDGSWAQVIAGPVDRVEFDLGAGLVCVEGRDRTALFIEARIQETFENQTASEIAATLALRRGLLANVTPTTSLIGRDFGGGHAQTAFDQYCGATTEWDLLASLADGEGFDVWVDGETLNFAPPQLGQAVLALTPEDCTACRMERVLTLCGDLQVSVKSWDCRAETSVSQVAGSVAEGSAGRTYVLIRPNLTAAAAASLASRTLAQMTQSARVITLDIPGELMIRPRQTLAFSATGTDFDGSYVVVNVERRISFDHGFTQTVQARTPPWTASSTI
jgi:phage protein D